MYSIVKSKSYLAILLTVCLSVFITSGVLAVDYQFTFNPPDKTSCVETAKVTTIIDMGKYGKRTEEVTQSAKVEFKKTDKGYTITVTPILFTMTYNGKKFDDPFLKVLKEIVLIYELDAEGNLVELHGFEGVEEIAKKVLSAEIYKNLAPLFNEERLKEDQIAVWNKHHGLYVGQKFAIGEVWTFTDEISLAPDEQPTIYSAVKFLEGKKVLGHNCVWVHYQFDLDPTKLGDFMEEDLDGVYEMFAISPEDISLTDVEYTETGKRLIDPTTMLLYEESRHIVSKFKIKMSGKEIPVAQDEKRIFTYQYSN